MRDLRYIKESLIMSCISMLLCISLLAGTTWAWFRDNATTPIGNIEAGTFGVDLVDADGDSIRNIPLSFQQAGDAGKQVLWEPGATYYTKPFRVSNTGTLAFKYRLFLVFENQNKSDLESIYFRLVKADEINYRTASPVIFETNPILKGETESDLYVLVGSMRADADNSLQGKEVGGIGIKVAVAQASHESDITGPDYDLNAEYLADAKTPAELAAILGVCIPNIEFSGSFAAEASGSEPVLTIDYDAVIDLKGFEFTVNGTGSTNGILLSSGSSTIRNGSISANNISDSAIKVRSSELVLEHMAINGEQALQCLSGSKVTLSNCTITGTICVAKDAELTIKESAYSADKLIVEEGAVINQ